ncbi:MAG: NAD-dependent epimerase/dehydratase family protein [Candidatus Micrarchaeia archaeon]
MKAIVTGASGRLGRALLARLRGRAGVRALVRSEEAARALPKGVEVFYGDVREELPPKAFAGVQVVFHLAAVVSPDASEEELREVNVEGTRRVLAACPKKLKRFVHVSSISVYGKRPGGVVTESTPFSPSDGYGWSKLYSEMAVKNFARVPWTIIRPGVIYGKGFREGFFEVLSLLEKGRMPLIGPGDTFLPLVHARDVCDALLLAAKSESAVGRAYNIVGEQRTQAEVLARAAKELGVPFPRWRIPAWAALGVVAALRALGKKKLSAEYVEVLAADRRFDCTKARTELGWKPKVGLEEGIKEVIEWYKGVR